MKLIKNLVLSSLILSSFSVIMANVFRLPQVHAAMREEAKTSQIEKREQPELLAQITGSNDVFTVTLQGCNRSGDSIKCYLLAVSKLEDGSRDFSCTRTRVFDTFGNEYNCSQVQAGSNTSSSWASTRFLQNIPVKVIYTFKKVPSQVDKLAAFDIGNSGRENIKFLNVTVSK